MRRRRWRGRGRGCPLRGAEQAKPSEAVFIAASFGNPAIRIRLPRINHEANMKQMQTRKSQMEIMGLAVIVILLTLGSLFVIQFVVLKPQSEIKKTFTQTQTAANTLTALLRTSTGCKGTTIIGLLDDCAKHPSSDTNNRICCLNSDSADPCVSEPPPPGKTVNGKDSCAKASELIEDILKNSLQNYGISNYEFRIINEDYYQPIDPIRAGECLQSKESKQAYFRTSAGVVTIYLDVC